MYQTFKWFCCPMYIYNYYCSEIVLYLKFFFWWWRGHLRLLCTIANTFDMARPFGNSINKMRRTGVSLSCKNHWNLFKFCCDKEVFAPPPNLLATSITHFGMMQACLCLSAMSIVHFGMTTLTRMFYVHLPTISITHFGMMRGCLYLPAKLITHFSMCFGALYQWPPFFLYI